MDNDYSQAKFPNPHPKQIEVMVSPQRYKVLNWSRRSGKSMLAAMITFTEAMKKQGNYYIVAPTERQAKSIYWNDVLKVVVPKGTIAKVNNVERTITFHYIEGDIILPTGEKIYVKHDTNLPPSTISLRGVDNPDALRGVSLSGAVLDEYAFMDNAKYVFDTIISPALADKRGWAMFISTPNGIHNAFYDLVQQALDDPERYFFSHATALDNPYFPKEEFEEQKKKYISEGKLDAFVQEWEAEFRVPSRLVYKAFNRDIHVIKPEQVPREGTHAMGIDFGWVDPLAIPFCKIDYEGNWYIYDEIYQPQLTPQRALPIIQGKMADNHFSRIVGDAQAKSDIASFKELKFYIQPSQKGGGSVRPGVTEVASLLEPRDVFENGKWTQKPRLYVTSNCKNTIKEFESYSHMTDAFGEPTENPEDRNNHLLDALRYLVMEFVVARKPRERRKRSYDPVTGRVLS